MVQIFMRESSSASLLYRATTFQLAADHPISNMSNKPGFPSCATLGLPFGDGFRQAPPVADTARRFGRTVTIVERFAAGVCTHALGTIIRWKSSSKIGIFLAELLCFGERACRSKHCSTTWKAEKHWKTFSR